MAIRVWNFCGGWDPVRVPYAVAYFAVTDVDLLMDLLMVIRGRVEARQAAQREANGR